MKINLSKYKRLKIKMSKYIINENKKCQSIKD